MTRIPRLAMPYNPSLRRWLPLIVGLAVGIRIALGWMHPFELPDSADYTALATALAHHQPYASVNAVTHETAIAARMPGYPLFLAAIFTLGGGVKTVMVLQGLMGGAVVVLTYLMGRHMGESVGLLAALLLAIDPLSIGFSAAVLSETPFTLCLMASLWLCLKVVPQNVVPTPSSALRTPPGTDLGPSVANNGLRPTHWLALGLLWAAAVYLRASALWLIIPLALLTAWFKRPAPPIRLAAAIIPLALTFALLTPWLIRNYSHFHSGPLRLTTLEGISLYEAVYPDADGGPRQDIIPLPADMQPLNEAQRNDEWSRRAWASITGNPLRIARLALVKIGRTWSPWFNAADFKSRPIQIAMTLWSLPLFLCALIGITKTPRKVALLLLLPILYFTAVHALFLGSVRYRAPLMPVVCLFAAAGIISFFKWLSRPKRLTS